MDMSIRVEEDLSEAYSEIKDLDVSSPVRKTIHNIVQLGVIHRP